MRQREGGDYVKNFERGFVNALGGWMWSPLLTLYPYYMYVFHWVYVIWVASSREGC